MAETQVKEEKVLERLPMYLNLADSLSPGSTQSIIGWADVFRDPETGIGRIEITLDERGSEILDHLQEISKLMAIGFAGVARRPEDGG